MTNILSQANMSTDADAESRRRIVSETDKNFFVEAGAGSGKTTLLVRRMTAMVEQGKDIREICAITFTKAAAGEFYDRFRKLLLKRSREEAPDEEQDRFLPPTTSESRSRCEAALRNIDLCFMGTIDSFCNRILSEHPVEAGLPSELRLISDDELDAYLRQAYVRISRGEMGGEKAEELRKYADLMRQLHSRPEEVFALGAAYLLQHRNAEFHYEKLDANDVERRLKEYQDEIRITVKALLDHPEKKPENPTNDCANAWTILTEKTDLLIGNWKYRYSYVLRTVKELTGLRITCAPEDIGFIRGNLFEDWTRKVKNGEKWCGTEIKKDFDLLKKMQSLPYDLALSFLTAALPVLEAELNERGAMTYFDYLYYLRNMLRTDAAQGGKLAEYISSAHKYYLIDEFQDTDPLQAEVFFYLSAKSPQANWTDCKPREGSLFIVGDPKQSIYRFRNADVTSFLRVKALFEDPDVGEVLSLSRNFRSTKDLRSYFNRVFSKLLRQSEVQSGFEQIPIEDDAQPEGWSGIYRYQAYMGRAGKEHPEETDEKQVGRIIRQLVDSDEYRIWDKEKKEQRRLQYSDFMLITVTKSMLSRYNRELERLGIPYRVEGNVPFEECPSLKAVAEVYTAVADPKNGMAVYTALKGRLIALEEEDIRAYAAAGGKMKIPRGDSSLKMDDCQAPARVRKACAAVDKLKTLSEQARDYSPSVLFSQIAKDWRVFEKTGGDNAEIFWYVEEKLRSMEADGSLSHHREAASWLTELAAGRSKEERNLSLQEKPNTVHLANLHKIKGLEAPVVILAGAIPKDWPPENRIEYAADGTEGYLFRISKRGEGFYTDILIETSRFEDKKSNESDAMAAERDRTLYVAATRAENALIICESFSYGQGRNSAPKIMTRWQPLIEEGTPFLAIKVEEDLPNPADAKSIIRAAELYDKAAQEDSSQNSFKDGASFSLQTPSRLELLSPLEDRETRTEDASSDPFGLHHRLAATLGTMTHRLMEMLVSSAFRLDTDEAVQEILREYEKDLSADQLKVLRDALLKAGETMLSGGYPQENGTPQDLFAELKTADEIHYELPFTYRDGTETPPVIWDGVMDLVYKKDGRWSIVDYKTNADGSDLDLHYQRQLEAYKKAFLAMTGEEAETRIYHVAV